MTHSSSAERQTAEVDMNSTKDILTRLRDLAHDGPDQSANQAEMDFLRKRMVELLKAKAEEKRQKELLEKELQSAASEVTPQRSALFESKDRSDSPRFLAFEKSRREAKPFGKRVFDGGIPSPLVSTKKEARFSKRMFIAENQAYRRAMANPDAVMTKESVFSPRSRAVRDGLCSVDKIWKKAVPRPPQPSTTSLPPIPMPPTSTRGEETTYGEMGVQVNTARACQAPTTFSHWRIPQTNQNEQVHVREVRTYDNFIQEKGPRKIPTKAERLERYYTGK